jgi:hypothetical protein
MTPISTSLCHPGFLNLSVDYHTHMTNILLPFALLSAVIGDNDAVYIAQLFSSGIIRI